MGHGVRVSSDTGARGASQSYDELSSKTSETCQNKAKGWAAPHATIQRGVIERFPRCVPWPSHAASGNHKHSPNNLPPTTQARIIKLARLCCPKNSGWVSVCFGVWLVLALLHPLPHAVVGLFCPSDGGMHGEVSAVVQLQAVCDDFQASLVRTAPVQRQRALDSRLGRRTFHWVASANQHFTVCARCSVVST